MLKCIYVSNKTLAINPAYGPGYKDSRTGGWMAANNAILVNYMVTPTGSFSMFDYDSIARVFRDATVCGLSGFYDGFKASYYIPGKNGTLYGMRNSKLYSIDPHAGVIGFSPLYSGQVYSNFTERGVLDLSNNVGYTVSGNNIRKIALGDDSIISTTPAAGMASNHLFWTKEGTLLGLHTSNDSVRVWPVTGGDPIFISSISSTWRVAGFDPLNSVLITCDSDYYVRHYILEIEGSLLSSVTADPSPPVALGGALLSVTLTGVGGEVLADYWIRWSLFPAIGSLDQEYTKTNVNGIATNYYYSPVTSGDTIIVTAEVTI